MSKGITFVYICGFALILTIIQIKESFRYETALSKFKIAVVNENYKILTLLEQNFESLQSIQNFFAASNFVDEREFHSFTKDILNNRKIHQVCFYGENTYVASKNLSTRCEVENQGDSNFVHTLDQFIFKIPITGATTQKGILVAIINKNDVLWVGENGIENHFLKPSPPLDVESFAHDQDYHLVLAGNEIKLNLSSYSDQDLYFPDRGLEYFILPLLILILTIVISQLLKNSKNRELLVGEKLEEKESELQKQFEELMIQKKISNHRERLATVGQLAAGVAHEINNPLQVIFAVLNPAKKTNEEITSIKTRKLMKAVKASERIANIVSGLRNFSRSDQETNIIKFDFQALMTETVEMLQEIYSKEGVDIESNQSENGNKIFLHGDRGKLQQVIVNLISNARDATVGQARREIKISASLISQEYLEVKFTDNGCGINEELQEKIFEPFFTTKEIGTGTGIGLAMVLQIINESFKGEVTLQSKEGEGTTFTLKLPIYHE